MKPVQNFDAKNLGWMRRHRKQFHLTPDNGSKPADEAEWGAFLESLQRDIALGRMKFERLHSSLLVRGPRTRVALSTKSLDESLVLRKINDNLRRSYGIRGTNRGEAVTTLMQALGENTPKAIYRVDIKSCFESISRSAVLGKLRGDGLVSYQTIALVDQVFERATTLRPKVRKRGLPRGLILSGTLAEIYLAAMDRALRDIDGVYLVLRYVDDFVVMSSGSIESLVREVHRVLIDIRLRPNTKKTKPYFVGCKCTEACMHGSETVPYIFDAGKAKNRSRKIALMHPASQRSWALFYERYDSYISQLCVRSTYSLRAPSRPASRYFDNRG